MIRVMDHHDLSGRVAIVTGAGRGLGAAIARALAAAGAAVAVNDINPDRAERVAGEIRAAGGRAIAVMADVSNKFQCVNLIESTRAEWGRLDIVVNAAAIEPSAPVLKMDEWEWTRVIDVNLKGVFFMCQLAGRVFSDEALEQPGTIVTLGGTAGGRPGLAAFAAAKAGAAALGEEVAREFAPFARAYTVMPGPAEATVACVLALCGGESAHASGATVSVA